MTKRLNVILFILPILIFSCKETAAIKMSTERVVELQPKVDFKELESDFMTWWTYHTKNISLSSNFIALDELSDTIEKKQFLEKLTTGTYIPLKLKSKESLETYQLFKLDATADNNIRSPIKNESLTNYNHLKMEGMPFPEFEFTDLKGHTYNNDNTKGKTIILKTWFINCKACVAEFPELNELVDKYQHRDDLIFISLALDSKTELEAFLKEKRFKYNVVPNQKTFIADILKLQIYPTHIVIDKKGTITKVVNKASEMISLLEK
ncbi:MAG: TlpA family protein disulfide reductase [Algicola sp.]|nr:TlpA family protein disulfide reductase [Algicola sp.]